MNLTEDVPVVSDSIWPSNTWEARETGPRTQFDRFMCFVLCPFTHADIVVTLVRNAAMTLRDKYGPTVEVYFAGDLVGSGAIHPEIWTHVRVADIIVADLTGYNPNVVLELGVAAAWRPIETVILIRDESDGQPHAFDLQPARQRFYNSTVPGWAGLLQDALVGDMVRCIARAPFRELPPKPMSLPFEAVLQSEQDTTALWSPGPGHRRPTTDGLEFGSPIYFPYSWLSAVGIRPANVRVQAEMRFSTRMDSCWIGIALRSQGYLVNHEHLAWLGSDGNVYRTGPDANALGKDEEQVGTLSGFDPGSGDFITFDIQLDDGAWSIKVGTVSARIPLASLPYVFGPGRVLLQTFRCRAYLRRIRLEEC